MRNLSHHQKVPRADAFPSGNDAPRQQQATAAWRLAVIGAISLDDREKQRAFSHL